MVPKLANDWWLAMARPHAGGVTGASRFPDFQWLERRIGKRRRHRQSLGAGEWKHPQPEPEEHVQHLEAVCISCLSAGLRVIMIMNCSDDGTTMMIFVTYWGPPEWCWQRLWYLQFTILRLESAGTWGIQSCLSGLTLSLAAPNLAVHAQAVDCGPVGRAGRAAIEYCNTDCTL